MSNPTSRPAIPAAVKREVRQRCGFGCVICGLPIYDYDHLLGWAEVRRHVADEIALLCPQHHREKTAGLLTQGAVTAANADPHNIRAGWSTPFGLHFEGRSPIVRLGSNLFTAEVDEHAGFYPVVIDKTAVIAFRYDQDSLLLAVDLRNECNEPALQIFDNEVTYSTGNWDVDWVGRQLTVREQEGDVRLRIEFAPPCEVRITKGRLLLNGVDIRIEEDHVAIAGSSFLSDCVGEGTVGINAGWAPGLGGAIGVHGINRYRR